MGKRCGHTNTGEGVKGKTARTVSDNAGGKSVSEKREPFGHLTINKEPQLVITNGPVYMCERGAWGRGGCGLARDIPLEISFAFQP
jgi:hypothetical protein